jgi:lipopolysaccharide export system protein LptA
MKPCAEYLSRSWRSWVLVGLLGSSLAQAQVQVPPAASGSITVTADEAEWQQDDRMRYRGRVQMASPDYRIEGELLELDQTGPALVARIEGTPAKLEHQGGRDASGRPAPPVTASAEQLRYDAASGWIELEGNAQLTRGGDRIDGREIRYNLLERRIQARGSEGGQVRIVIQPSPSPSPSPGPAPDPAP